MTYLAFIWVLVNCSSAFLIAPTCQKILLHQQNYYDRDPSSSRNLISMRSSNQEQDEKNIFSTMFSTVDIPEEYRDEIFKAEANTPAAKDREGRVLLYGISALFGIAISFFNAFLTTLRGDAAPNDLSILTESGFGWVDGNPLFAFLFLTKIGGGIALVVAGLTGTLLELEQRTKNETAEKIYKELQRRKATSSSATKKTKKKKTLETGSNNKKKVKNQKRLGALAEVIADDIDNSSSLEEPLNTGEEQDKIPDEKDGGFMGKMKDFYKRADSMAASQALLLNKELEDKGIVENITDETGLRVIGKDAASKLKKEANDEDNNE